MFQSDVLPSEGGGGTVFSQLFNTSCSVSSQLREYLDGQSAVSSCSGHVLLAVS
jgi:hypothetical protein